jgi:hypothetical protein
MAALEENGESIAQSGVINGVAGGISALESDMAQWLAAWRIMRRVSVSISADGARSGGNRRVIEKESKRCWRHLSACPSA